MTLKSRRRRSPPLATQSAELALAVPQVMAHRLTRMALAGPVLSARDQKEFALMVNEKTQAFGQAWAAMALASWQAQQSFALAAMQGWWQPSNAVAQAALQVASAGLKPVHRKAVANAKRLGRTRLK